MFHDTGSREQPEWEHVREVVEDWIAYLPQKVNRSVDIGQFYDVAEAHSILSSNDLLLTEYELSEECVSANKVFFVSWEIRNR